MDEEERFAEKVGMAAARNGFGDCRPTGCWPVGPDWPAGMGEGVVRLAADWAAGCWGGVAEAEFLLAPCIISSAISVTGSFRGTFGADSVSCRYSKNQILKLFG